MKPRGEISKIIWLKSIDSTNSAMKRDCGELDNLSVIAGVGQSKGRGQGDHSWFATPGKNLTFSILMRFSDRGEYALKASEVLTITCITTLALRDYLLDKGIGARIKWPNDIWVGERKICGILIENSLNSDEVLSSIVGIGLNVNETDWPEDLPNPVSMTELSGKSYAVEDELPLLLGFIGKRYAQAADPAGRAALLEEFEKYKFILPSKP